MKFIDNFEIHGVKFTIKKAEGDNLIEFWKAHGGHFELCVGKNKQGKAGRDKRGQKGGKTRDMNRLKNPITLGDET